MAVHEGKVKLLAEGAFMGFNGDYLQSLKKVGLL